jgi:hypothetical protein
MLWNQLFRERLKLARQVLSAKCTHSLLKLWMASNQAKWKHKKSSRVFSRWAWNLFNRSEKTQLNRLKRLFKMKTGHTRNAHSKTNKWRIRLTTLTTRRLQPKKTPQAISLKQTVATTRSLNHVLSSRSKFLNSFRLLATCPTCTQKPLNQSNN